MGTLPGCRQGTPWHLESPGDPATSLPVATGRGFVARIILLADLAGNSRFLGWSRATGNVLHLLSIITHTGQVIPGHPALSHCI